MYMNRNSIVKIDKPKEITNGFVANIMRPETIIPIFIKVYFLMLVSLGANCGVSTRFNSSIRSVVKYYTIVFMIVNFVILAAAFDIYSDEFWYWLSVFTGLTNIVVLKKSKYKVFNFVNDMHSMGKGIKAIQKEIFGLIITLYLATMYLVLFLISMYTCANDKLNYCKKFSDQYNALYTFAYLNSEVVPMVQFVICYYIYSHVIFLRSSLEADFDIDTFAEHYIALAECFDKIRPFFNSVVSNVRVMKHF